MAAGPHADSLFWRSLEKRIRTEWLAITVATLLATVLLSLHSETTGLSRLDQTFYDGVMRASTSTEAPDDIVIIAIDDGSIEALGHWPWRRHVHAQLLDRLSQARRVGFDIVFSEPNLDFPEDDALLAEAIRRHGRVVLPTIIVDDSVDGTRLQTPMAPLADAASGLGYINIYPHSDGTVRTLTLSHTLPSGQQAHHFSAEMMGESTPPPGQPGESFLIPYAGPAGHFSFYPYAAVLHGDIPAEHFHDRLVLVGAWSSGLGDTFPTPLTRHGETMAGVEILANGMLALENGNWIRTIPAWLTALLSCLPVLLLCLAFRRLSPRHSLLATFFLIVCWCAASAILLFVGHIWMPVTAGLIGIALAFPLWSWRSQEASLQHIDQELLALQQVTAWDSTHSERNGVGAFYDHSLPTRVRRLHQAIARFRHVQQKREETLRFLSHDMRAPQSAILALIEMQRREPELRSEREVLERIKRRAVDTLELMDGFVQVERAEVVSLNLKAIELSGLLHEACDSLWELAHHRSITLSTDDLPDEAWVEGDHKLLSRVLRNLLDNAIKYSPDHTEIRCRITREGQSWRVAIEDQGFGMAPEQLERIFEPFTRVTSAAPDHPSGAGLGLAFARTTILRHGGTISADSREGKGSTFSIILPALDS